jgi:hypothetical protein
VVFFAFGAPRSRSSVTREAFAYAQALVDGGVWW